ncbi:RNA polymerase II transcription elongation factor-domain-containing protein [Thermothelomyces heterothallicus CBS 202.75]|uniref:RNA polymerase II transcription elongation factor-domain-containing protein n=1 Tax=Thermothelomyces heterothallicus CBS 202.75 TaxID=1149848 RepID=UPI0037429B5C
MAAQGVLDPTKPGQYPVILSDALLGKPSKDAYVGIRYNHRPALSSDSAPNALHLKKSAKDGSFNLGFEDQGNKYQYNGVRTTGDGNYVLIFDPARKVFVLHQVESTFHMNITRTPTETNAETLRQQFPHLEVKPPNIPKKPRGKGAEKASAGKATAATKSTPTKAKAGKAPGAETPKAKEDSQTETAKAVELTLPDLTAQPKQPEPSASQSEPDKKAKRPALSPVESEEEEDDDDGGLTVEYPEGDPAAFRESSQYLPTFPASVTRRFSEFAKERESEEDDDFDTRLAGGYEVEMREEEGYEEGDEYEDGDEEEEEEEEEGGEEEQHEMPPARQASPPRPVRREDSPVAVEPDRYTFDEGDDDEDAVGDDALEEDIGELEAALAREFEQAQEAGQEIGHDAGHESDSSVSVEE